MSGKKPYLRVGIVVSKKVSKSAVARNKIKRRLATLLREVVSSNSAYDIVIIAQAQAGQASYEQLRGDLTQVLAFVIKEGRK